MRKNKNAEWLSYLKEIGTKEPSIERNNKTINNSEPPLISIPPDKLFELYGNLIMAGFSEDEALIIVIGIARNDTDK